VSYLDYATWILSEHLRLWDALSLCGCLWWYRLDRDAARLFPEVPAGVPTHPAHGRGPEMDRTPDSYFERLVASAGRIARHASYPGKQQAVDQCVADVEDLIASGRVTAAQGEILLDILSGACPQMA